MGGIVSSITDAVGLTNTGAEKQAAKQASENSKAGIALSKEQIQMAKDELDFQKEKYKDWEDIYGPMQTNLGNYYNSLSPDKLVALGLENQQKEFQAADTAIKREFAQRGLTDSGQEIATSAITKVQNATARATIRTSADQLANEQKMQFLGLGLGQGTQMLGLVGNAASNVTSAFNTGVSARTSMAGSYLNQQTQFGLGNMQAMSDVIGSAAYLAK